MTRALYDGRALVPRGSGRILRPLPSGICGYDRNTRHTHAGCLRLPRA
jgi:hypothetical protein